MLSIDIDAEDLGKGLIPFGAISSPFYFSREDILERLEEVGIGEHHHFVLRDETLLRQGRSSILDLEGPWFLDEDHHYTVVLSTHFTLLSPPCCITQFCCREVWRRCRRHLAGKQNSAAKRAKGDEEAPG